MAALTLVSQNLGAQNVARAEQSAWEALKSGTIWMTLMGVGFIIWREPLVLLFTNDATVIPPAEMCLVFIALGQPFLSVAMILGQALRGAGDIRATLVVTFIGIWLVRVAVGYILGIVLGLGLFGMWIGWLADFGARSVLMYTRFQAGKWKTLKI